MFEFKIINTPDKSQQAVYQHGADELVIGREEGDLILDDPQVAARQLRFFFEDAHPVVENLDTSIEVRLNGRAVEAPTPIKDRDHITFAKTTLQMTKMESGPLRPPPRYENATLADRTVEGTREWAIFEALKFLGNVQGAGPTAGGKLPPPVTGSAPPKPPTPPMSGKAPPPLPKAMPPIPKK